MKGIEKLISGLVILHVCAAFLFAADPGKIKVVTAFEHRETGNFVVEIIEYFGEDYTPSDEEHGRLAYSGRVTGFYWGNLKDGFYKMHRVSSASTSSWGRFSAKFKISAPSPANVTQTAGIVLGYSIANRFEENETRTGHLEIACGGKSACLETSETGKEIIARAIEAGEATLHPLPNIRQIKYAFKVPGENKYFLVDGSRFVFDYPDLEIATWNEGEITFDAVVDSERSRDAEYQWHEGATYLTLRNGDLIYSPPKRHTDKHAALIPVDGPEVPLIKIVGKGSELRRKLDLPRARYRTPILRTPCELLVSAFEDLN